MKRLIWWRIGLTDLLHIIPFSWWTYKYWAPNPCTATKPLGSSRLMMACDRIGTERQSLVFLQFSVALLCCSISGVLYVCLHRDPATGRLRTTPMPLVWTRRSQCPTESAHTPELYVFCSLSPSTELSAHPLKNARIICFLYNEKLDQSLLRENMYNPQNIFKTNMILN